MESLKVQVGNRWFTVEITDINSEWIKTKVDGDIIEINITELEKTDPVLQEQAKINQHRFQRLSIPNLK